MKINLSLFLILGAMMSGFAQYRPAVVGLKSGDSISGIIGDIQRKSFNFKTQINGKSEKVDFSEIDFVRILYSGKDLKTFKFFKLNGDKRFTEVEQLATGKNVELYGVTLHVRSPGYVTPVMGHQEVVKFYIRKPAEDDLTMLGIYDPVFGDLKEKVINYFSDCPELTEKILNKDFKVRKDMVAIVEFYNSACNPL
jgi:hypothetical protein